LEATRCGDLKSLNGVLCPGLKAGQVLRESGTLKRVRVARIIIPLILVIPLGFIVQTHATPVAPTFCLICAGNESLSGWGPQYPSVNVTLDSSDKIEGSASLKVAITNETRAVGVAYDFGGGMDFSNVTFIVLWVKTSRLEMLRSLYISVGDTNANWRQFDDFGSWFALEPGRWTRVAVNMSHFLTQGEGFDAKSVRQLWFGSYDGGVNYYQVFSLDDIRIEGNVQQTSTVASAPINLLPVWFAGFAIVFLYGMTLPLGLLATKVLRIGRYWTELGTRFLPILLALGIALEAIVFLASSLVFMNSFVVWTVWAFALTVAIVPHVRSMSRLRSSRIASTRLMSKQSVGAIGTLLSLGFSIYVMSTLTSILGWAPPNDSFIHALIVSLILSNNHLGSSFSPVSSIPLNTWNYSRGFYGLPSALSFALGIYPGQSVMLVGAAIAALFPALLYSMTLIRTRSPMWATVAFLSAFILPTLAVVDSWAPSNDLLFGAFLVATYPSLMGNLLLLTLFAVIVLFDDLKPISLRSSRWLGAFILLTACIAVTYYPYVLFPILYLACREALSIDWPSVVSRVGAARLALVLGSAFAGTFFVFELARGYAISQISLNPDLQFQLGQKFNPLVGGSPYLLYAFLLAATIGLGFYARLKGRGLTATMRATELFFGILLFIHALSLSNETLHSSLLWMTNPSRSIIVLYALTFAMIPIYLSCLNVGFPEMIRRWRPVWSVSRLHIVTVKVVVLVLVLLAFSPMIVAPLHYVPSSFRPDILQVPHDGDYLTAQWIASNVGSNKLILNDISLSGLSLTSFRALHVVNDMQRFEELYIFNTLPTSERSYMLDANRILQHPGEYAMVLEIMQRYNISYIYISNSSRTIGLFGSGVRFAPPIDWTMTQAELLAVYLDNPYLRLAYQAGDSAVFELR
jgi:hypothetical protein